MATALRSRSVVLCTTTVVPVLLALLLAGCGAQGPRQGAGGELVLPQPPFSEPALPVPVPEPEEPAPIPLPVAVVLSADTSHYRSVADALGEGRWQLYVLNGDNEADVLAEVRDRGHLEAIAVGRQALALLAPTNLKVAYCQVFGPVSQPGAARPGVAPLPDFPAQLDAWLLRQPALARIGIITGPDHLDVAERLESAAAARSLMVRHAVARSDREMLYVFRRLVPEIQGFLLYPDTSILSPSAIRELLAYARKHEVRVLTYNRSVFELGADLLISADPGEVARRVVAALEADTADGAQASLDRVVVEIADAAHGGAQ
jgi:hypothetical protein